MMEDGAWLEASLSQILPDGEGSVRDHGMFFQLAMSFSPLFVKVA